MPKYTLPNFWFSCRNSSCSDSAIDVYASAGLLILYTIITWHFLLRFLERLIFNVRMCLPHLCFPSICALTVFLQWTKQAQGNLVFSVFGLHLIFLDIFVSALISPIMLLCCCWMWGGGGHFIQMIVEIKLQICFVN